MPTKRPENIPEQYVDDVLSGKVIACKWVKLACKRHLNDLERFKDKDSEYYFNPGAGLKVVKFFEFLRHSKGQWAGQVFKLSPWQQFVVYVVFGWLRREDKSRRFQYVYLEVARKNGKTTLIAGLGLYLLDGDGEPGAEIYSVATKHDQAMISHSEATRMVKSSALLRDHIRIYRNNLHVESTASKFEPVGRDTSTLDGLNVHGALIDELHVHKTRDAWDVMDTATGARLQPLMIAITTAGFDKQSICWEQHSYTERILTGVDHPDVGVTDDTYFGIIYTLDEGEEEGWDNEDIWVKANPNIDIMPTIRKDLKKKAKKAFELPSERNAFLRKHLDIWTESETLWITPELWKACGGAVDSEALRGRICYAGLDLSTNKDITAFVMVFPPEAEEDPYRILCRFFIPQDNMEIRVRRDRVQYDVWVRAGYITATPGNVIDYHFVVKQIEQDLKQYDIREIAYDRWGATKIMQDLQDLGFDDPTEIDDPIRSLVRFGQGYASMSPPMKALERMILAQEIAHGGNPVLAWMASNVVASEDPAENIKPNKEKSRERIDGIVALIMGLDRSIRHAEVDAPGISFI